MIYVLMAFVGLGLVLLLGMFYGAVVGDIFAFRFRTACQGRAWRSAFPSASKASIRKYLQVFVDAFAFPASKRLTFGPDDSVLAIYRQLYPSRWIPDALELETFAKDLEALWGVRLESMWSEQLTLGEVFAAVQDAQPFAAADGFAAR
jgi:propanediol dehydratase small subunit